MRRNSGCPRIIEKQLMPSLGHSLWRGIFEKISKFFQKRILYEGVYSTFGGSQIHPPGQISKIWPDFP
jgi:hypothetical protein